MFVRLRRLQEQKEPVDAIRALVEEAAAEVGPRVYERNLALRERAAASGNVALHPFRRVIPLERRRGKTRGWRVKFEPGQASLRQWPVRFSACRRFSQWEERMDTPALEWVHRSAEGGLR